MNSWRIVLWVGLVIVLVCFLYMVRGVLPPFVLALVIAVLLEPVVRTLRKTGFTRPMAVITVLFLFFGTIAGLIALAAPNISQQYTDAQTKVKNLYNSIASQNPDEAMASIDVYLKNNQKTLEQLRLPTSRAEIVEKYIDPNRIQIENQTKKFITGGVFSIISVAGQLFMFLLTPVFVFGLLIDLESLKRGVARFIPPSLRRGTLSIIGDIGEVFQSYLRGLVLTISLYTLMMGLILGVVGAPYFIVLALVAGMLYLIPVIGGIVSSAVIFLVIGFSGITQGNIYHADNSWTFAIYTVAIMFVFGFAYDSLVNPRIVGRAVKLNPVLSAFVVFSAGALFGLPGMLLAYPVAGAIKVILDRVVKFTGSTEGTIKLPAVPLRHRQAAEA